MAELLSVRDLRIEAMSYPPGEAPRPVTLVDGVSFDLAKGRVLGLIGELGAGKSTIGLATLAYGRGGARIVGGKALLNGQDILALAPGGVRALRGAKVCYVAQSAAAAFNPAHRLGEQVIEASAPPRFDDPHRGGDAGAQRSLRCSASPIRTASESAIPIRCPAASSSGR